MKLLSDFIPSNYFFCVEQNMWKKSLKQFLWMLLDSCKSKTLINSYSISLQQLNPNYSGNNFRRTRKLQTLWETTFAKRGNAKPFGKELSPCAEMPNLSGNDFRQARKFPTFREMTFVERGNAKPFGKRLSPYAETPNHSGNDFRRARKWQTF